MTAPASSAARPSRPLALRLARRHGQEIVILAALLALLAGVGALNPRFLAANNLVSIFSGNSYIAVAAIGMAIVIVTGHIDVSIGALIGVLATISGTLVTHGYPVPVAWGVPVVIGVLVDAAVGALVAYAGIPSIVVTLGMLSILRGGLIAATGGAWISGLPPEFLLAQGRILSVPVPVVAMVVFTALVAAFMALAPLGRAFYAVGGNPEAARATGLSVERLTVAAFAANGLFAGLAAILFATQLQVIQSTVPPNLELTVITAAVIGGVSILGGTGTVVGSTLAAMLFGAIASAFVFVGISPYWRGAVIGTLILITVLADMARRRRFL